MKLTFFFIVFFMCCNSICLADNDLTFLLEKINKTKDIEEKHNAFINFIPELDRFPELEQTKFWHALALHYELNGKLDKSIKAFDKSIELLTKPKVIISEQLIFAYTERAYMKYLKYYDTQYYCPDRAIALNYARQLNDPIILAKSLINMVFCQAKPEEFVKGIELLDEAITLAEQYNLSPRQHALIFNASYDLYRKNQVHRQSYEFLLKAIEMWEKVNDYEDIFNMTHNLVTSSIQLQDPQLANQHLDTLFQLAKEYPNRPDFEFFAYYNKARIYLFSKEWELAKNAAKHTLSISDKTQEKFFVKKIYEILAMSHARLNNMEAANNTLKSLNQAFPDYIISDHRLIAILAFYAGNYNEAVEHFFIAFDKEKESKLSFVSLSAASTAASYNQRFVQLDQTILKKELEIKTLLLNAELKNKQMMYLSMSVLLIITFALFVILYVLNRARNRFKKLSKTDYLTGICNRRAFIEEVEEQLSSADKKHSSSQLILIDLDNFKQVNDTFGHDVGDQAIVHVVKCSSKYLPKEALFGRIGGEEFALFLPNFSLAQASDICEDIRQAIESHKLTIPNKTKLALTISLGCTSVNADESLSEVMKRADELLYKAKKKGRNNTVAA